MANLDNLKNLTPYEVNTSRIGQGEEVPLNIINYVKDNIGDLWIDSIVFAIFIILVWIFSNKKDPTVYGTVRAVAISSLLCFVFAAGLLLSGFSKNIYPIFLYGSLSMFSSIIVYIDKKKGF